MANPDFKKHFAGTRDERYAKAKQKRDLILRFLYEETYSDSKTLAALLGLGAQSTNQTLGKMERAGLLKSYMVDLAGIGIPKKYWGITLVGGELAAYEFRLDPDHVKPFEKRMINVVTMRHKLAIQHLILNRNLALGVWGEQRTGEKSPFFSNSKIKYVRSLRWIEDKGIDLSSLNIRKQMAVPDVFLYMRKDAVWAIEVELTIKSKERYKTILRRHCFNIEKSINDRVIYVLETEKQCARLRGIVELISKSDPDWVDMVEKRFSFVSFELMGRFEWAVEENIA